MPSESELREILRGPGDSGAVLDVEAVVRRARARRRPRLLLAAGAGTLALAGILVPASVLALGSASPGVLMVAQEGAGDQDLTPPAGDTALDAAPADRLNLCEGALADVAPAANGLVLEVAPMTADATATSIPVVVTLRNDGDETVRGTTAATPALTLSRDGVVLWHSNGPMTMIAVEVDLAPGESLEYAATLRPEVCAIQDDVDGFREQLPAAGPGDYRVGAAIDFTDAAGTGSLLVTGPAAPVELR